MNRATQKKTLAVEEITIVRRRYVPHMDAYFALGTVKNRQGGALPKAVVGWHSRHNDKLVECRFFPDLASARNHHRRHANDVEKDKKPDHPSLKRDWQKRAVYDWEDFALMPFSQRIDEKAARNLIRAVSRDYGIEAPQLEWLPHKEHSEYDEDENTIYFGARDKISLLHELAHAVHAQQIDGDDMPDHSPGFVWCAAGLYHRYAGISLNTLVLSAHKRGLLGDMETRQAGYGTLDLAQRKRDHAPQKTRGPRRS